MRRSSPSLPIKTSSSVTTKILLATAKTAKGMRSSRKARGFLTDTLSILLVLISGLCCISLKAKILMTRVMRVKKTAERGRHMISYAGGQSLRSMAGGLCTDLQNGSESKTKSKRGIE